MADSLYRCLKDFPRQCKEALQLGKGIALPPGIKDITLTGVGGSAFVGDVLRCALLGERDIFVNKNYTLPHFIGRQSLVIVSSYSGNTEEALAAYEQAVSKGATILGLCKGGELEERCREARFPFITIPRELEDLLGSPLITRYALGFMLIPLLNALHSSGLIASREREIRELIPKLESPALEEEGKQIASKLVGKTVMIYTPAELSCIGYGWAKTRLNETSKAPAFYNEFPNLNHDEMSMYQNPQRGFHVIFFIDHSGDEKTRRRMELSSESLKEKTGVTVIPLEGPALTKILTALHLGDWASYYLARETGADPVAVPLQETIKKAMQDNIL